MSPFHFPFLTSFVVALCAALPAQAALTPEVARGVIVQLKPSPDGRETPQALRERLASVAAATGLDGTEPQPVGAKAHLLRFAQPLSGTALEAALRRARLDPQVASVEPDVRLKRQAEPNDPYYANGVQWYLKTPAAGGPAALNLPPAWARTTGSAGIVVAVVDSGATNHPDLAPRLLPGYDLISDATTANDGDGRDPDASDPGDWVSSIDLRSPAFSGCRVEDSSWHGTFIAGQIGAMTNNGGGIAGVDWGARIQPVRVSGKCGAWLSDVVDGIRWAAGLPVSGVPRNPTPARVINVSFGGSTACTPSYQSAIDDARGVGSLVVVASGNENGPLTRPADCAGVLAVSAVRQDGLKSYYSNYGANTGIMAPGGPGSRESGPALYSTSNAGTRGPTEPIYDRKDGTSFAAPLAAGVASLVLAMNPQLSPAEVISRIQSGARPFPSDPAYPQCSVRSPVNGACNCTRETCGPGLLDADRALQLATSPAVVIVPLGTVPPGSVVTLDGRGSTPVPGSSITGYNWSLTSGPPVSIQNANTAVASVALPGAGTWVFRLLVTDSAGRSADNYVSVSTSGSGGGGSGSGGGATAFGWGLGLWVLALLALRQWRGGRGSPQVCLAESRG